MSALGATGLLDQGVSPLRGRGTGSRRNAWLASSLSFLSFPQTSLRTREEETLRESEQVAAGTGSGALSEVGGPGHAVRLLPPAAAAPWVLSAWKVVGVISEQRGPLGRRPVKLIVGSYRVVTAFGTKSTFIQFFHISKFHSDTGYWDISDLCWYLIYLAKLKMIFLCYFEECL